VWFEPPAGVATLPRPEVIWHESTFAQVRFPIGAGHVSYFFEAKRRRVSPPRPDVLAVDMRRLLIAQADGRAIAVRQMFAGREVAHLQRDWSPGPLEAAITAIHFDPDTRLTLSYLRGPSREPTTERLSIPSIPRPK
jgi:hypothetical protein